MIFASVTNALPSIIHARRDGKTGWTSTKWTISHMPRRGGGTKSYEEVNAKRNPMSPQIQNTIQHPMYFQLHWDKKIQTMEEKDLGKEANIFDDHNVNWAKF